MCGIAGVLNLTNQHDDQRPDIRLMLSQLRHRGPEQAGIYEDAHIALGQARLSIVDLVGGRQPIPNEDGSMWVACNGEFYDYQQTQLALMAKGHHLHTASDSEIILHLYEEMGVGAIDAVSGQYAFAIWDSNKQQLWLGRDRVGIRPLYYTIVNGRLLFASEIKALLAGGAERYPNYQTLAQIFTTWGPLPGHTMFDNIYELPAGHFLIAKPGSTNLQVVQYWQSDFTPVETPLPKSEADIITEGHHLLLDAVRTRLVADVPVGAYLSGGLDSTLTVSLAQQQAGQPLHTYSITFDDADYDESAYQLEAAQALGTNHHILHSDRQQVQQALPATIWHSEVPVLRLAPVPMKLLAQFVHAHGLKVVLTGEGADEFFGGYTIFREAQVRQFMARNVDSEIRPLLLKRLYAYQPELQRLSPSLLKKFFGRGLDAPDAPYFSHMVRWHNSARGFRFFSAQTEQAIGEYTPIDEAIAGLPAAFAQWDSATKAQFIEATTFMPMYLLSSQGDRMAMAHAVEGRYPFLDHHVIEWINQLPTNMKIRNLQGEKYILKQIARNLIPKSILDRPKQPYRAPIQATFAAEFPAYAAELLAEAALQKAGYFDAQKVAQLCQRIQGKRAVSRSDQMSFMGILTTQLWHHQFMDNWSSMVTSVQDTQFLDMAEHYKLSSMVGRESYEF